VAVAVVAALPFIQFSGAGIIAIAATAMIYFSYFLGNLAILRDRLRGWPRTSAPFRLRRWGLVVNVLGLLYGGAMLVNFAWPRAASNPTPKQTGVLDFHMGWVNGIPILWTVFVFLVIVGLLYYLITGRRKDFAPVTLPADEPSPMGDAV
jgi:membrane protease YdiL (CAAX protease family)